MKSVAILFLILFTIYSGTVFANIVGSDANNFNTTTSGLDFITVQSSKTLDPGIYNLGLYSSYFENSLGFLSAQTRNNEAYRDGIWTAETNLGFGLGKQIDGGVSLPFLLSSATNAQNQRIVISGDGLMGYKLNLKFRFLGGNRGSGMALVASMNHDLMKNNPYAGNNPGPTAQAELAIYQDLNKLDLGYNIGYRFRNPGERNQDYPITPYKDQWIGSFAASYFFPSANTKLIAEIYGSMAAQEIENRTDRGQNTMEWILGSKHDFTTRVAGIIGGGSRIGEGTSSPDWRAFAGLNIAWGGVQERIIQPIVSIIQAPEPEHVVLNTDVYFDFDSDQLKHLSDNSVLELVIENLRDKKFKKISVEGHTDYIGTEEYNIGLSQRRAKTVADYLVSKGGFESEKVDSQGFGESRPIADNSNYQGRQQNRRVELVITWE